MSNTYSVLG